jgi:hypothetical protein
VSCGSTEATLIDAPFLFLLLLLVVPTQARGPSGGGGAGGVFGDAPPWLGSRAGGSSAPGSAGLGATGRAFSDGRIGGGRGVVFRSPVSPPPVAPRPASFPMWGLQGIHAPARLPVRRVAVWPPAAAPPFFPSATGHLSSVGALRLVHGAGRTMGRLRGRSRRSGEGHRCGRPSRGAAAPWVCRWQSWLWSRGRDRGWTCHGLTR